MIIISKDKSGRDSGQIEVIRISSRNVSSVRIGSAQNGDVIRVAGYRKMLVADKRALRLGTRFVLVPDEERARQRIDAYSYLIQ